MEHPRVTTIDGPAGSGKSKASEKVAAQVGGIAINSGSFYRLLAWEALRRGLSLSDIEQTLAYLKELEVGAKDGVANQIGGEIVSIEQLKSEECNIGSQRISNHPSVRALVNSLIHKYVETLECPIVCEGRDAGRVIFEDAPVKIYLTASPEVRATRGNETLQQLLERDEADQTKPVGYLLTADQAREAGYFIVDSTTAGVDEVVREILDCMYGVD